MSGECTAEEYGRFLLQDGNIKCLTKRETIGLVVIVEAGLVSLATISCLFVVIVWRRSQQIHEVLQLSRLLVFSLMLADVIQAIGMTLSLRWIMLGKVEVGMYCTAQGIIKTIGVNAVALFTLAIAIHTLLVMTAAPLHITLGVVMAIWVFDVVIPIMGLLANSGEGKPSFMSVAPYWCSTRKESYLGWKVMNDVWRWIALLASILTYIFYLRMRYVNALGNYDMKMLVYPLTYFILVLPMTVVRWLNWWVPSHVPSAATFATESIFGLSGFINAILLVTTRRRIFGL